MAVKRILKEGGQQILPITRIDCIVVDAQNMLDDVIAEMKQGIQNNQSALDGYVANADFEAFKEQNTAAIEAAVKDEADRAKGEEGRIEEIASGAQAAAQAAQGTADQAVNAIGNAKGGLVKEIADLKAADTAIRNEFAAADTQVLTDAKAYADEKDGVLKQTLEAVDAAIRSEFADADAQVLADAKTDAASKVAVEKQRAEGEEAKIRSEFANADAQVLADAKTDAASKVDVEKQRAMGVEAELQKAIDDLENEVSADGLAGRVAANEAKLAGLGEGKTVVAAIADAEAAAKGHADAEIAKLVDSAPETMNTLNELATAIANHGDVVDGYVETINGKITAAEVAAKKYADDQDLVLKAALQKEIDDDVKVVADALAAEVSRADAEEKDIRADFAAADAQLKTDLQKEIDDDVAAEAALRVAADGALQAAIDAINGENGEGGILADAKAYAKGLDDQVRLDFAAADAQLKLDYIAADSALHTTISTEIDTAVKVEVDRAKLAEQGLQGAVDAINHAETGILAQAKAYAKEQADGKDNAIVAAKKAGDDAAAAAAAAQGDVDALEIVVGDDSKGLMGRVKVLENVDANNRLDAVEETLQENAATHITCENFDDSKIADLLG